MTLTPIRGGKKEEKEKGKKGQVFGCHFESLIMPSPFYAVS
jgi:hypothetical protein